VAQSLWAGQQAIPEPFNWLGLAEVAGTLAAEQLSATEGDLEFAVLST